MRMRIADNKDLLELKIDIKCTNEIAYMDCALLLDKPKFLRLLPEYRKKHGIKELVPYMKFYDWTSKKMSEDMKMKDEDMSNALESRKIL